MVLCLMDECLSFEISSGLEEVATGLEGENNFEFSVIVAGPKSCF